MNWPPTVPLTEHHIVVQIHSKMFAMRRRNKCDDVHRMLLLELRLYWWVDPESNQHPNRMMPVVDGASYCYCYVDVTVGQFPNSWG